MSHLFWDCPFVPSFWSNVNDCPFLSYVSLCNGHDLFVFYINGKIGTKQLTFVKWEV